MNTLDDIKNMKKELEQRERIIQVKEEELERKQRQFELEWKLLEYEQKLLALDRDKLEKEKELYNKREQENSMTIPKGVLFFLGVHDELSLKKRYRDLIKVFHPDNYNGDLNTMQVINKEYERLIKIL